MSYLPKDLQDVIPFQSGMTDEQTSNLLQIVRLQQQQQEQQEQQVPASRSKMQILAYVASLALSSLGT